MLAIILKREKRFGVKQIRKGSRIEADACARIQIAPIVRDLKTGHSLTHHREIEDAAAGCINVIECQPGFIEPHLQCTRLKRDLDAAAGENQSTLLFSITHEVAPLCCAAMCSAA